MDNMANTGIITFMRDRRSVIQGRGMQCMYMVASLHE